MPVRWIGLAEVKSRPGDTMFSGDAVGGYISVVASARTEEGFIQRVTAHLEGYGVSVEHIGTVRRLQEVLREKSVEPRLMKATEELSTDDVALGTLFTYAANDEETDEL
jgi:hypothetical protein